MNVFVAHATFENKNFICKFYLISNMENNNIKFIIFNLNIEKNNMLIFRNIYNN